MRKKGFIRFAAAFLTLTMVAGALPVDLIPLGQTVEAATVADIPEASPWNDIQTWDFASDTQGWKYGTWSTTGMTGSTTAEEGRLKLSADYTTATKTYYQGDIALTPATVTDYSSATNASVELYCKVADQQPTKVDIMFVKSGSELAKDSVSLTKITPTTEQVAGEDYYKYQLSITLSQAAEKVGYREATKYLMFQVVRSDATFNGDVYFDNITLRRESNSRAVLNAERAVYDQSITASLENVTGEATDYQWYQATAVNGEGTAIDAATSADYTPALNNIGGWIYAEVVAEGVKYKTKRVRVVAGDMEKETAVTINESKITTNPATTTTALLTNTKSTSGTFDTNKLSNGGYFYVEYTGELTAVPQFELGTWSGAKTTVDVVDYEHGSVTGESGTFYAKYSYADCVAAWGEEDFSELKALRIKYAEADSANLTIASVSWFGAPTSYGEMGEEVALKQSNYLFTKHVGGDFDATRIREDSYFYIEWTGDEDAVSFVANSHSVLDTTGTYNRYVTVTPSESGTTGSGYYRKYTASQIQKAFGEKIRYIDQFRLVVKDGATATPRTLYFFEGTGALMDDISVDGYSDVVDVPWPKYAESEQDGIVIIGASITQNPLVTPLALSGAPYYNAQGGWNTVLDRTDCITYGIGSQTTINVANRFKEILKYNYKQIIIQCGNNDLGAFNDDAKVVAQEVTSYTTMLNLVKAKNTELAAAGKEPITVHIISLTPTNSEGMQNRIIKVNAAIKELCTKYSFASYIDELSKFQNKTTGSTSYPNCSEYHVNMELVMPDGLHPVAAGYKIWAQDLKAELASKDAADTTLTTLSYRMSDDVKKNAVTGFKSAKSTGSSNTYNVELPAETGANASFKLYVTASNLNATVVSTSATEITEDSYKDAYIPVTLKNGSASTTLKVTSEDTKKTETYTVNFTISGTSGGIEVPSSNQTITVSDVNVAEYPYVEYPVTNAGVINSGATVEYDIEVANNNFTGLYIETDFNWAQVNAVTLAPTDFTNSKNHVKMTYIGEGIASLSGVQIKTGGEGTDYRGDIIISNLKITNAAAGTGTDDKNLKEISIWSGSETTALKSVFTSGNFDMDNVVSGGYFYVQYKAAAKQAVTLAMSEWDASLWKEAASTASGEVSAGVYYAKFSYDACVNAYGSSNLSEVDALSVKTATAIEVTDLKWFGPELPDDGSTVLFKGSKKATGTQAQLTYLYTKHVGGDFDASQINEGSYFAMEYTGDAGKLCIALASASGATDWVAVQPTKTETLANGRFLSTFSVADCIAKFGTNFKRLDQIQAYTYGYDAADPTATTITLRSLKYYPGTGAVIDAKGESKWTNKELTGIGFIGDSIVQNALLSYGDWNTIIGRDDCVNWGIGGQTTVHIEKRIDDMLEGNYDKIVILCGINDMGNGVSQDTTIANYKSMFAKIHDKLPNTKVYVISVLPTREPFYVDQQDRIIAMDSALKTTIADYSYVTYVDCYSKFIGSDGYVVGDYVSDGLHPNEEGYRVIASVLKPLLNVTDSETTDPGTTNPGITNPGTSTTPETPATPVVKKVKKNLTKTVSGIKYKVIKAGTDKVAQVAVIGLAHKKATKLTIPATVKINDVTCKVTSIAAGACKNYKKLKTVTIGKNVTSIGSKSFYGCKVLKTITIKSTILKSVGSKAISGIGRKAVIKVPKKKLKTYKKYFSSKTGKKSTMRLKKF